MGDDEFERHLDRLVERYASSPDAGLSVEESMFSSIQELQAHVRDLTAQLEQLRTETSTQFSESLGQQVNPDDSSPINSAEKPDITAELSDLSDEALVASAVAARVAMVSGEVMLARCTEALVTRWVDEELSGVLLMGDALPEQVAKARHEFWFHVAVTRRAHLAGRRAVHEIAVACGVSEYSLTRQVNLVREVQERLPHVWEELLAPSTFDCAKAAAINDTTGFLSPGLAQKVAAHALAGAETLVTPRKLRAYSEKLAAKADPVAHAQACRTVHDQRAVTFRPETHGTASMTLTAPADTIARIRTNLETRLAQLPQDEPGQERRDNARRADIAIDLLLNTTFEGQAPTSTIPAQRSGEELPKATGKAVSPKTLIHLSVPLSAVLGGDAPAQLAGHGVIPAQYARELIADLGNTATWRCVIVDDRPGSSTHGSLVGFGKAFHHKGYEPPPLLHEFIAARDGTCQAAGCHRPAQYCDADHITAFSEGGPTCDCNLHALCRHHHQLKHMPRGVILAKPLPAVDDCPF